MGNVTKETVDAYNNKWVKRDLGQLRKKVKQLQAEIDNAKGIIREYDNHVKRLKPYKVFYGHIRGELLTALPEDDFIPVVCKICDKTFEEITGIAEQALKEK